MGLGDIVSKVITEYRADTSDVKAKLKELSAVEKERAKQQIEDADAHNKRLEGYIRILGDVGLALNTLGKFADFARNAMREFGEHTRLTAVTAGVNVDRLSKSFNGLVSEHELLTLAAQTSTGVLKLNQGQMETLGQAAVALRNRGFDLEESLKKLTDAAVKGKVGGLDDLGLSIKEGASSAETLRNMMTELNKVIAESGTTTKNTADDVQKLATEWDNTTAALRRASVEALKSIDIQKAAADLYQKSLREDAGPLGRVNVSGMGIMSVHGDNMDQFNSAFYGGLDKGRDQERYRQGMALWAAGVQKGRQSVLDSQIIEMPDDAIKRSGGGKGVSRFSDYASIGGYDLSGAGNSQFGAFTNGSAAGIGVDDQAILDQIEKMRTGDLTKDWNDRLAAQQAKKTSFLEGTFGKLEDFNAYAKGFELLTGAVTAGLDAWIDGSVSAGEAIKKFLADALKGLANQMAVEALKHGAYALGSLAFGDVRGAGQHAAAAAAFGAGAIAAAVASKELGGGGANAPAANASGGSGGSGGGSGGGGSSGGSGQQAVVVVYGDVFAENTARERSLNAEKIVKKALGGSGGVDN